MKLQTYLERIKYTGSLEPNLPTLHTVHRAHLLAIPYENLDIHLGKKLTLEPSDAYQKIVLDGRGGWCFEMNGLLAWALREIGFEVRMVAGSVNRDDLTGLEYGDHLVLLVNLEGETFVVDVGFGDGFPEPLPLVAGEFVQNGFAFRLERREVGGDDRWIMHNHAGGGAQRFDFGLTPRKISHFVDRCAWLQTSPDSGFVRTTVCQRFTGDGYVTLRGAVFKTLTPDGETSRVLESEHEYTRVLRDQFGLTIADVGALWAKVCARHFEWLKTNPAP